MTCEDWPCCGHEIGCCPNYDDDGNQLNMVCTCGASVPLGSPSSMCTNCLSRGPDGDWQEDYDPDLVDYEAEVVAENDDDYGPYADDDQGDWLDCNWPMEYELDY